MPRFIDADALQADMMDMAARGIYGLEDMIDAVIEAPTVSPDEVRGTGKWKAWEDYYGSIVYKCSVCGEDWDMIDGTPEDNDMNYCPNCGAKMEVSE